jgi:hypothetical protein
MARELFEIREKLAPSYSRPEVPMAFDQLPSEEQKLLIATAYFFLDAHSRPYCPHPRIVLRRAEITQCLDCGMYAPRQDGYGHLRSPVAVAVEGDELEPVDVQALP